MICPWCNDYLGDFDSAGYHRCSKEPPTNWLKVICFVCFAVLFYYLFVMGSANAAPKCQEPRNPYWAYDPKENNLFVGFESARKSKAACDGYSLSFNDGCKEYYRQLNEYNKCKDKK